MKGLSSVQEDKIIFLMAEMIIENNPEYKDMDDEVYDAISLYGLLEGLGYFYYYLQDRYPRIK